MPKLTNILPITYLLLFLTPSTFAQDAPQQSADQVAAELANPNTPLATLTLKLQYRDFSGDLPNADSQDSTLLLFQPSLPFPLDNGDSVIFRPAIPILIDQPVFNPTQLNFDSNSGLGDISFDLAYAKTSDDGLLTAVGLISTLPTATDESFGSGQFSMGPEFLIGKITDKYVLGAFPNHQWDINGWGDQRVSTTTSQFFATYLPGGGWNIGSSPIISYNHVTDEMTLPLNFTLGKTVIKDGRPWKFSLEINYYLEQPDSFGSDWMVGISIAPVVSNIFASWFD